MLSRWVPALALLQLALAGLMVEDQWEGALATSDLRWILLRPHLSIGTALPATVLYGERGWESFTFSGGRATTFILSSCAECNQETIRDWTAAAQSRKDRVAIVLQTTPDRLAAMRRHWNLHGDLFASAGTRVWRRFLAERLPLMLRVSGDGVVLGALCSRQTP